MGETTTPPAKPKHRAVMQRGHFRTIFIRANQARGGTRSEERWLNAAVAETEDVAELAFGIGGMASGKDMINPEEKVEQEFSDDAAKGIKLALVQAIKGNASIGVPQASIAVKNDLLNAASCFGAKFRALVEKESLPPESTDLEDDKPLDLA
jgi:hypothetical protein